MSTATTGHQDGPTCSAARPPSTSGCEPRPGCGKQHRAPARPGRASARRALPRRRLRPGRDDAADGPPGRAGGRVCGIDVDAAARPPGAGHAPRRRAQAVRVRAGRPGDRRNVPGAPYDLVYARLLLFHVADPAAVLRRLWDAVAPGGLPGRARLRPAHRRRAAGAQTVEERMRVVIGAFAGAGRDVRPVTGCRGCSRRRHRRARRHRRRRPAGAAGGGGAMLAAVFRSLLPAAVRSADARTTPRAGSTPSRTTARARRPPSCGRC